MMRFILGSKEVVLIRLVFVGSAQVRSFNPTEHQQQHQAQKEYICVEWQYSTCSASGLGRMAGRCRCWGVREGQRGVTYMGTSAPTLSMPTFWVV